MKSAPANAVYAVVRSHPARGAWIEIPVLFLKYPFTRVAPRKGCVD